MRPIIFPSITSIHFSYSKESNENMQNCKQAFLAGVTSKAPTDQLILVCSIWSAAGQVCESELFGEVCWKNWDRRSSGGPAVVFMQTRLGNLYTPTSRHTRTALSVSMADWKRWLHCGRDGPFASQSLCCHLLDVARVRSRACRCRT